MEQATYQKPARVKRMPNTKLAPGHIGLPECVTIASMTNARFTTPTSGTGANHASRRHACGRLTGSREKGKLLPGEY
ncbi:MAG: hypothetical protein QOF48_2296 [Verrucomicrobiota bacterium]|jgi:hypothetical protein